jgi:hypothetical protein
LWSRKAAAGFFPLAAKKPAPPLVAQALLPSGRPHFSCSHDGQRLAQVGAPTLVHWQHGMRRDEHDKAAQSKSMDEMVTVSETVAAACSKCHEPYRDFDDPKDRCQGV